MSDGRAVGTRTNSWVFGGIVLIAATFSVAAADAASLPEKRRWYEDAKVALTRGDEKTFWRLRKKLDDYPLHPYLDYREFVRDLARPPAEFEAFVRRYRTLPFDGTVRSRYLHQLADDSAWKTVLRVQKGPPNDEPLQCIYYRAHLEAGARETAWAGARKLWSSGDSVSDRCDPLFDAWAEAGERPDALVFDRMLRVFGADNGGLLRYLAEQLSADGRPTGDKIISLFEKPETAADFSKANKVSALNKALVQSAFQRWVRRDVDSAIGAFDRVVEGQHLSADERQKLADYAADRLLLSETEAPDLVRFRDRALGTTKSVNLLARRIRLALTYNDWEAAKAWVERLPERAAKRRRWRFWRGRIALRFGRETEGRALLESLLGQPNFYSAAAATELGRPIVYPREPVEADLPSLEPYGDALERIRELIALNKVVDAKREWRTLLYRVRAPKARLALAKYASANDWYHLTVQASVIGRMWDYPSLRFPLAFKWWFEFFSKERDLPAHTMLAVARLESALNTHAESGARARGLLQILPSTAREVSRKIDFDYEGAHTLFDAGVNIRLGSYYLKAMLQRWDENRVLAFASYNAGYTRVRGWKAKTDGKLDVYAFIEQIPFSETRAYVQNALLFELFYARRLGGDTPLLHRHERRARY